MLVLCKQPLSNFGLSVHRYFFKSPFSASCTTSDNYMCRCMGDIIVSHDVCVDLVMSISSSATHWLIIGDDSIQVDDIRMSKLGHDGCLLEELHSVFSGGALIQCL